MAANFTRSSLLGQNPDFLSAQVEEAAQTYQNALALIGRARGISDPIQKAGYINQAISIIEQADSTFDDNIKQHPMVAETIKKIQVFIEPELQKIESFKKTQAQMAYIAAQAAKPEMEQRAREPSAPAQTSIPEEETVETATERKFPFIPVAVAAGAIALAMAIGG